MKWINSDLSGSAPTNPISHTSVGAASHNLAGPEKGISLTGTLSREAISVAISGAIPIGSPYVLLLVTRRIFDMFMPALRIPLGAS